MRLRNVLAAALFACSPAYAASTIDPTKPAAGSPYVSSILRENFAAAATDINNILSSFYGLYAPSNPSLFQHWIDTSTTPFTDKIWDGAQWIAGAKIDTTAHQWIQPAVSLTAGVSGVLPAVNGGLGTASLTGYVYCNGASPCTAATTVPLVTMNEPNLPTLTFTSSVPQEIGPPSAGGGLNLIPFGYTSSYLNIVRAPVTGTHAYGGGETTMAIVNNTPGSGIFGVADADYALILNNTKTDYSTSLRDGEFDTLLVSVRQGRKGDAGGFIGNIRKTRTGVAEVVAGDAGDTGGVSAGEIEVGLENASGVMTNYMHILPAFYESPAGLSGGIGYGNYVEARLKPHFSAYGVDTLNETGAVGANVPCWNYITSAAAGRGSGWTGNKLYYSIRGDCYTGVQQPGDTVVGTPGIQVTTRSRNGTWALRPNADNADLMSVDQSGHLVLPSLLTTGTAVASLCIDASGNVFKKTTAGACL
jgi:hypothetical protein